MNHLKRNSIDQIVFNKMSFYYLEEEKVFNNINASFYPDDVIYLKGPRGSGKTTLMKMLLGLIAPKSGDFIINEENVSNYSHDEFNLYRLNMGFSFDVGGLINNLTLYENFKLVLDYHNYLDEDKRFDYIVHMMSFFNLEDQKHLRPSSISSSARKAASVLRSFLLKPQVLILNDPSQGLSVEHLLPLINLIKDHQLNHQLKFIFISSDDSNLINLLPGKSLHVAIDGFYEKKPIEKGAA